MEQRVVIEDRQGHKSSDKVMDTFDAFNAMEKEGIGQLIAVHTCHNASLQFLTQDPEVGKGGEEAAVMYSPPG